MIHIHKAPIPPSMLAEHGYGHDAVKTQLLHDQHDKCYLCERKLQTNYQVEHLKSQRNHPESVNEWTNLFIACEYCNEKKQDNYDDILNPAEAPVETLIRHAFDAKEEMFRFEATGQSANFPQVEPTIRLLTLIFNGRHPRMLTLREKRFRQDFLIAHNSFRKLLIAYSEDSNSKETIAAIADACDASAEYLGFKFSLIDDLPELKEKLQHVYPRTSA